MNFQELSGEQQQELIEGHRASVKEMSNKELLRDQYDRRFYAEEERKERGGSLHPFHLKLMEISEQEALRRMS